MTEYILRNRQLGNIQYIYMIKKTELILEMLSRTTRIISRNVFILNDEFDAKLLIKRRMALPLSK